MSERSKLAEELEKKLEKVGNDKSQVHCEGTVMVSEGRNISWLYDLNSSPIISALIKEAGTVCENYSSDLIYSLMAIDKEVSGLIRKKEPFDAKFFLGFRSLGVDADAYISASVNSPEVYGRADSRYHSIYCLEISGHPQGTLLGVEQKLYPVAVKANTSGDVDAETKVDYVQTVNMD